MTTDAGEDDEADNEEEEEEEDGEGDESGMKGKARLLVVADWFSRGDDA